jgi:hypothetical protein
MKKLLIIAVLSMLSTAILHPSSAAPTAKAGAKCKKVNSTQTVGTKKFTCIKSGSKLVWNRGIVVAPNPTPVPTASVSIEPSAIPGATIGGNMGNDKPVTPVEATTIELVKFKNCTEAKAAGAAPLNKSINPALYELNAGLDRDKDGIACEN